MPFVIRSMSTTDYVPGQKPVPYHVYLKPPGKRHGAWWTHLLSEAMQFSTVREAEEAWLRHWDADKPGRQDIAPVGVEVPDIWDRECRRPRT